jgi:hypothetical protein
VTATAGFRQEQVTCVWCGEPLKFEVGRGWFHQDGQLYQRRMDPDGVERDDHCALPRWKAQEVLP